MKAAVGLNRGIRVLFRMRHFVTQHSKMMREGFSRAAVPALAAIGVSVLMTWPLAAGLDRLGPTSADGLYSVWNVAWVARTLSTEPVRLFDANIFYPDHLALAYSEANLGAGLLGVPGWVLTQNAYVAHNTALLAAFAISALGAWLLARRLTGDSRAAAAAGLMFAFCPYLFAHTAHIQLLLCGGIPLSLLMFHRLADAPTPRRGIALGLTIGLQGLSSAYYGVFAGLIVGYAILFFAASRRLWSNRAYWHATAVAAGSALIVVLPFFPPYISIQEQGFGRTLEEAARYSANVQSYFASPARAHGWLLALIADGLPWTEVLFPGFLAIVFGAAGLGVLWRRTADYRGRETALFYGSLGGLAVWASFGPSVGLYTALSYIPVFSFLRAPARFGIVLPLTLSVFAAFAFRHLLRRLSEDWRLAAAVVLALAVLAELRVAPFGWDDALPEPAGYRMLAKMPAGPVANFPFFGSREAFPLHTRYMVYSTLHWQPLLNGYSDFIPARFRTESFVLDSFPSRDSFKVLQRHRTRYIGIHWNKFGERGGEIRERLKPFMRHLRRVSSDKNITLYEIVSFP
jgi:hypothetical protein